MNIILLKCFQIILFYIKVNFPLCYVIISKFCENLCQLVDFLYEHRFRVTTTKIGNALSSSKVFECAGGGYKVQSIPLCQSNHV